VGASCAGGTTVVTLCPSFSRQWRKERERMASFLGQTVCESQAVSKSPLEPPSKSSSLDAGSSPRSPWSDPRRPIPGPYRLLWASFAEEGPPQAPGTRIERWERQLPYLLGGLLFETVQQLTQVMASIAKCGPKHIANISFFARRLCLTDRDKVIKSFFQFPL
jgi:hypothetical protein